MNFFFGFRPGIALALVLLGFSAAAGAEDRFAAFSGTRDEVGMLANLRPVSSMDDDDLFRAARAIQMGHMSAVARVLNHHWLQQSQTDMRSSTKALGRLLRLGVFKFWSSTDIALEDELDLLPDLELDNFSIGEGDYSLRASAERVSLHFELIF